MKRKMLLAITIAGTMGVTVLMLALPAMTVPRAGSQTEYRRPPGSTPPGLEQEIQRVEAEVDRIEQQALAQWQALPISSSTRMQQARILGQLLSLTRICRSTAMRLVVSATCRKRTSPGQFPC
jgi:hypothetical protein